MSHFSTKTYGHEQGLSCVFRQPHASHSHCRFLHGYALAFKFTFGANELDDKNWVMDFGGLKDLKQWLKEKFDHKLVVDKNDPALSDFQDLDQKGLCELTIFDGIGIEKFAEHALIYADTLVKDLTNGRCSCVEVECSEHGANSAIYRRPKWLTE